jgi:hypothetical protein
MRLKLTHRTPLTYSALGLTARPGAELALEHGPVAAGEPDRAVAGILGDVGSLL